MGAQASWPQCRCPQSCGEGETGLPRLCSRLHLLLVDSLMVAVLAGSLWLRFAPSGSVMLSIFSRVCDHLWVLFGEVSIQVGSLPISIFIFLKIFFIFLKILCTYF